jgi:hypothetical protein
MIDIATNYLIDYSDWFDEGGYCQVYPIKDHNGLIFKEFKNKTTALESYRIHKKLCQHDLAPKIFSSVCKLHFCKEDGWNNDEPSDCGYIIEKAYPIKHTRSNMKSIQKLVEQILEKTGMKFWDCHWYNVGLVSRNGSNKLVCIDTGKESFNGISNAWGFAAPGPKCCYCNRYTCECPEDDIKS